MHRRRGIGMYERGWGHHDGSWFWVARFGFLVVMLGLLALSIVLLVRALRQRPLAVATPTPAVTPVVATTSAVGTVAPVADDGAAQALRLRYARGEIARDEYLRTAADLGIAVPADAASAGPAPSAGPTDI